MNNYIYVLSDKENIKVEKLHICTWDLKGGKKYVELGVFLAKNNQTDPFNIYLAAPFIDKKCTVKSLHKELGDEKNFKFIFNEEQTDRKPLDDGDDGYIVHYNIDNEIKLAVVAVKHELVSGYIKCSVQQPQKEFDHLYFRLLLGINKESLARAINGITKITYQYDFQVNEKRNIPDEISKLKKDESLSYSQISSVYCLHCVPANYELSYSDDHKLQSIRMLETDAFKKYLKEFKDLKGKYIIIFQKSRELEKPSFFTSFSKEHIGNKQLFLAIGANIICSFLFAEADWRFTTPTEGEWYDKIPVEWWLALAVVLGCFIWCFSLCSWVWNQIKQGCSWIKRKCASK
ncbi:MAG: hypothetical protein IJ635_00630 [Bacteroidaceae bacterium]|nr:hypothetical protein [Bacteroidaceae bacterium]